MGISSHSHPQIYIIIIYNISVAQSCPTLCNPMGCSLSGSSIHGVFQARVLEWIAISFSRRSSRPRNRTQVSRIAGRCFTEDHSGRSVFGEARLPVLLISLRISLWFTYHQIYIPPVIRQPILHLPRWSKARIKDSHSTSGLHLLLLSREHHSYSYHHLLLHCGILLYHQAILISVVRSSPFPWSLQQLLHHLHSSIQSWTQKCHNGAVSTSADSNVAPVPVTLIKVANCLLLPNPLVLL